MITAGDRNCLANLRQRLEHARKNGDAQEYYRIYNDILGYGNRLVADQRWWEIWSREEAFKILSGIFAIPAGLVRCRRISPKDHRTDAGGPP